MDADGLAFLLWFCAAGVLALCLAWLAELYAGREARKRGNRYVMRDWHTERKCRIARNGFKTRAGIRSNR